LKVFLLENRSRYAEAPHRKIVEALESGIALEPMS